MAMFKTELRKGNPRFCRASYAVVVSYAGDGRRVHVETFYGVDGRKVRAEAMRYARMIERRDSFPWQRSPYLPNIFPMGGN